MHKLLLVSKKSVVFINITSTFVNKYLNHCDFTIYV